MCVRVCTLSLDLEKEPTFVASSAKPLRVCILKLCLRKVGILEKKNYSQNNSEFFVRSCCKRQQWVSGNQTIPYNYVETETHICSVVWLLPWAGWAHGLRLCGLHNQAGFINSCASTVSEARKPWKWEWKLVWIPLLLHCWLIIVLKCLCIRRKGRLTGRMWLICRKIKGKERMYEIEDCQGKKSFFGT